MLSQDFISDGCTILVHGYSRVVLEVLKMAASNRKLFRVLCTGIMFVTIFCYNLSIADFDKLANYIYFVVCL